MNRHENDGPQLSRVVFWVSIGILVIAVAVLGGWYSHNQTLVQVSPGLIPMQFNTALSFIGLGLAGLGISFQRRSLVFVGGGFAALMGLGVILEYWSNHSFGVDTFFFYPWVRSLSADPGRMALTTAISFFLCGTSLVVLSIRPLAYSVCGIANSIVLSLALTSLIGYAYGITYVLPFSLGSQMALHTSVLFFAFGVALLGYSWKRARRGQDGLPKWCPGISLTLLPVFLVGVGALAPEQAWPFVILETTLALVGVALVALAMRWLAIAKVAYKGLLMISLPLVLLVSFVGMVINVKRESESLQLWTLHSVEVVRTGQALLAQITTAESAMRGYAITEDPVFFSVYGEAAELVEPMVSKLDSLIDDNPGQRANIDRIKPLVREKMMRLSDTGTLIKEGNRQMVQQKIKEGKGFAAMEHLREEMKVFLLQEERLESSRRLLLDATWKKLSWLLVAGTAAAVLLAGILTLSFNGGISSRLRRLRDNAINLASDQALGAPLGGRDEIAELDRVFHEMAESLDEVTQREKKTRIIEGRVIDVRHTEALLKAGALQNAIFNSANFSSIATDAKGVIQIFNVGAERMLGYEAGEVTNKITPADISDSQEVIARAKALSGELGTPITPGFEALVFKASRGIEDIYELTYIRKDGSRFPAVVSVTALRDPLDAIIGYLLIGTDNTARKQAEESLLKAGALQSAIFNSANFSSIATDEKGVIQIFNVGAERMLGYSALEVLNTITPADISDSEEVIKRAKALSAELKTPITPGFEALVFKASRGIEDIYELTYIRKDGSRFPAVVSVTALRGEDKGIIGYLLIGTDNTARKQVEEEQKKLDQRLRDQQFYTRSLIESNIDALITTDPLGIITDVNKQMEALTGCSRDELIGAPFKNYFTDPERAEDAIVLVLSQKKVTDYELTAFDRNGKKTVVSYNATTFYDRDRKLQGVFAAARDVTERKRFESALQESNLELETAKFVAEKANLAKSDFLSSMSHELRSPLNAILGFAQLLESSIPPPTLLQKGNVNQIIQAGWHLLNLINEILDLAVIESGQLSLSEESVSLSQVMAECQSMMTPIAQQRGIQMTFPVFDSQVFVRADKTRLKQVIINLLSNAIKYNRQGGLVVVSCDLKTSPGPASGLGSAGPAHISVRDTGPGLDADKVAQLFQPFNRLGQEAGGVTGTGIGLVVTKRLVELMSGRIGVESIPGEGSTFWFELAQAAPPLLEFPNGPATLLIRPPLLDGQTLRTLLYVEDNPANMALVEQLIARWCPDIQLAMAGDAMSGIEMARADLPTVILMDINLPGLSGIEALKILSNDPLTAGIPVVALSANALPRDIKKGLEAGFFRYLTKPINVKDFMETLDVALKFSEEQTAVTQKNNYDH